MKNLTFFSGLFITLFLALSCTHEETTPCQYVDQITVPQSCYDPAQGLTLTASGYGSTDGLEWEVYVSKDTTINALDYLKIKKGGPESIVVPDSVLSDNPKILVRVITNCKGQLLYSPYISFVRRQVNSCTMWVEQRI